MKRRFVILLLLIGLSQWTVVPDAALAESPPAGEIQRQVQALDRIQERLTGSGALLPRYERGLRQLEETLQKGEYRHFHQWLEREVITPWRQVEQIAILQLAASPPEGLSAGQRQMLRRNHLRMKAISNKLRQARRLLTRLKKQNEERRRRFVELEQLSRRYAHLLIELEQAAPERARPYRDWLELDLNPRLDKLLARDRFIEEVVHRLERWTEDPGLRHMLQRIRQVTLALEQLRHRYELH